MRSTRPLQVRSRGLRRKYVVSRVVAHCSDRGEEASSTPSTRCSWNGFYNGGRLHEALADLPPVEHEELNMEGGNNPMMLAT